MKIIVDHIRGSRAGQRQVLDASDRLVFGRHPGNEVSFDAYRDLDASSRHAELVYEGGRYLLRDIGSSNGTLVKGERITVVPVAPGVPVEVEFGASGPRVRLFIGTPDSAPVPATAGVPRTNRVAPGARTLAAMWDAARVEAGDLQGFDRSSAIARSVLDQAIHRSTARFKVSVAAIASLSLAAIVILLLAQAREREHTEAVLERERALLAQRERDNAIRMNQVARMQQEGPGVSIASRYGEAVYLLVVERAAAGEQARAQGFCTGFAVAPRHLGTNAHCVLEAERLRGNGFSVYARRNADGARVDLAAMFTHPRYAGGLSEDVGLIVTRAELPGRVLLASDAQLGEVGQGVNIFALGFPGRLAKEMAPEEAPEATIVDGIIGRITDFSGERGEFATRLLVQHNLLTSPGTSGSPVFDGRGRVVAVNAGSYTESTTEVVVDSETGEKKSLRRSILTPGANYAIRIDALVELMTDNGVDLAAVGEGQ